MKITLHYLAQQLFRSIIIITLLVSCQIENDSNISVLGPIEAENALSRFEIEPGFKIELVVAEPLISDPVDMEIDEYGRLYVVEMHGYPLDKSGSGQIKLLSDTDEDGQMDKSTVFAEGLILPNGIMRWKKGVLVTDAPNVLYMEDSNGDDRADIIDTLLTGFSLSNPHVNVNNPVYGLDNWIYLAHRGAISTRNYQEEFGDLGTEVYFSSQPHSPRLPKNAESRSVRFRPDQHELQMMSSKAQFGHTFDAWGHYLLADNQNHSFQEVIGAHYLKRNPDLPISDATQSMSDHGNAAEVFQITRNPERQLFSGVGVMTSSCGVTAYLGGAFTPPFDKNIIFTCESVSNLVHVDYLKDTGATFISSRIGRSQKEFLASTDAWFRPVNMYIGPDGALYVVDYYRQIIEHPEWMSDEAVKAGGLYNGKDRGRIYRITQTDAKAAAWTKGLQLGDATSQELAEKLASPNIWWRINAQRLLLDRADKTVVPALVQMTRDINPPVGRLHALWALEGLGELKIHLIKQALNDPVAGIRENAIKLAELHLSTAPDLAKALFSLHDDPDSKVRFQLLCTLGFINTLESEQIRHKLLFRDINNKWVQVAALSASPSQTDRLLNLVLGNFKKEVPAYAILAQRLSTIVGAKNELSTIRQLIEKATLAASEDQRGWQVPVLKGLAKGLERRKISSSFFEREENLLIRTCFEHPSVGVRKASLEMLKVIGIHDESKVKAGLKRSVLIAEDQSIPEGKRAEAINFMALGNPAPYASLLKRLIIPQEHPAVQLAALKVLSLVQDQTAPAYILQQWPTLTPKIRDASLNIFMTSTSRVSLLLDAIEAGKIQQASLGWPRSAQLMGHADEKLRNRARLLLTKNDEKKVNREFQQALDLKGDGNMGKDIYLKNCAVCHQVRSTFGVSYGPDLGTVQNWLSKDIMANILDPNLSIAVGYDLWAIQLKSGETIHGIISNETSSAITLKIAPGVEKTLNRLDVESLTVLAMSAMPGVTPQIDQQQMANLLAFLRQTNM